MHQDLERWLSDAREAGLDDESVEALILDGRPFFAGACADGGVYLVDAESGEAVGGPLLGLTSQVLAVAVATLADGTVMVAAGGEGRRILRWDAATGRPIGEPLTGPKHWVMRLAFRALPDGRILLISADDSGVVHRWDAVSGRQPRRRGGRRTRSAALVNRAWPGRYRWGRRRRRNGSGSRGGS